MSASAAPAPLGDALRAHGLRRTPARLAVLGAIQAHGAPLSHADLAALPEVAELDAITVYRTLATLVEARLVHRVHGVDGVWRYAAQPRDRAGCPGNHPHFLCSACRRMTCLVDQPLPRVVVPEGARVEERHFVVFGVCPACAAGGRG